MKMELSRKRQEKCLPCKSFLGHCLIDGTDDIFQNSDLCWKDSSKETLLPVILLPVILNHV